MTLSRDYQKALNWLIDNVLTNGYFESFEDFLNHARGELVSPEIFNITEFVQELEMAFDNYFGEDREDKDNREFEDTPEKELAKQEQELRDLGIYQQESISKERIENQEITTVFIERVEPIKAVSAPTYEEEDILVLPKEPSIPVDYRQEITTPQLPHEPQPQEQPRGNRIIRFFRRLFNR